LRFGVDILVFSDLALVLATFSKNWADFFKDYLVTLILDHPNACLAALTHQTRVRPCTGCHCCILKNGWICMLPVSVQATRKFNLYVVTLITFPFLRKSHY